MKPPLSIPPNSVYPDWHYGPLRLLKEEIENPMGVVREFFSSYHLPNARKHLKEMLEDAMCAVEVYAVNYLTLYDDIEKLMEAAWLLLQEEREKKDRTVSFALKVSKSSPLADVLPLLITAMQPERIFLLEEEDILLDLLIVIPDTFTKPFSHYETIIEAACCRIPHLSFSLLQAHRLQQHIEEGHLFYLSACTKDKQVYGNTPLALPQIPPARKEEWRAAAKEQFASCREKAALFFEGAKTYFEGGNNGMALFMLHGATELTFRTIIVLLMGHEVKEHRIEVLKKHTRRCAPHLNAIFPSDTEQEKALLSLLDAAYLKARYAPSFLVEKEEVLLLLEKMQQLQTAAEDTFAHIMELLS